MILGLDISTACIGYTVFSGEVEEIGHINLSKYGKNQFTKTDVVRDKFISLKKKHNIDTVGIEQYMKFFSGGGSRAQTMLTLAEFNGRISQLAYDTFGVEPHYLNVLTARKLAFGSAREKNHKDQKLANLERVMRIEGNLKFEEKRNGGYKKHCFDEADAYTIARGLWVKLNEE